MPDLTIRFVNGSDLVSHLIDWETDSLWCHTEALSRDGKSWIGAHAGTGVHARPLDWCKPTRERRYFLPVSPAQYETAMQFLEGKVGCPYDYEDILGLSIRKRLCDEHRVICSALMTQFLMAAGLKPLNCLEGFSYLITPETLHLSPLFIGRCKYST